MRQDYLPVVALGGEKGLGDKVGNMVSMVAQDLEAHTLAGCGHFMTEERPQFVIDQILKLSARVLGDPSHRRSRYEYGSINALHHNISS